MKTPPAQARHVETLDIDQVRPGTRERLWIQLLSSPPASSIPATVERGAEEGPVVGVVAAVHGDELNGVAVAHALARGSAFSELRRGTLVTVPLVNLPGVMRNDRRFPDGQDLNRCMAGPERGKPSQRFAARFIERVASRLDYLVDLHTATTHYDNSVYARVDMTNPGSVALARALATPLIVHKPALAGSLRGAITERGGRAVTVELGPPSAYHTAAIDETLAGVVRLLHELDMLDGKAEASAAPRELRSGRWLRADQGGLADVLVRPGDVVEQGQPLAHITDWWGDEAQILVAPHDGVVLGALRRPLVLDGTRVIHLATDADELADD
jgi:predicted deacylase